MSSDHNGEHEAAKIMQTYGRLSNYALGGYNDLTYINCIIELRPDCSILRGGFGDPRSGFHTYEMEVKMGLQAANGCIMNHRSFCVLSFGAK